MFRSQSLQVIAFFAILIVATAQSNAASAKSYLDAYIACLAEYRTALESGRIEPREILERCRAQRSTLSDRISADRRNDVLAKIDAAVISGLEKAEQTILR